jgi:hypothetical protein
MSDARKRNRTRGAKATRKRTAQLLRSHADTVAHFGHGDARESIALDLNPNRGKRHAARMAPAQENSGARTKHDPRIELRTSFDRIPALGTIHTKNRPTWRS